MYIIVKALVFNEDGEFLAVRRSSTAPRRALEWDLPGGFTDENESISEAIIREVKEETGLVIKNPELVFTKTSYTENHGSIFYYFYTDKTQTSKVKLSYEHDKFQWVNLKNSLKLFNYPIQTEVFEYLDEHKLSPGT